MSRKWVWVSAAVLMAAALGYGLRESSAQPSGNKPFTIGVVNMMRLFNEYAQTAWLNEQFEQRKLEIQKELEAREQVIKTAQEALGYLAPDTPEYQKASWELIFKQAEREGFLSAAEYQMGRDHRDLTLKTYRDIEAMIERVAQQYGVDIVLTYEALQQDAADSAALRQQIRFRQVIYHEKRTDLTDQVLTELNAAFERAPKPKLGGLQPPGAP
jgi:Skp family chaperone for outer membrane proteins